MTLENAWKAAARHWWERLNEARGEARMWQQATAHACRSVELREKETEAFRAVNHELSLARDRAENERDIANTQRAMACNDLDDAREKSTALRCAFDAVVEAHASAISERNDALEARDVAIMERDLAQAGESVIGFEALFSRIKEADRKHPRDLPDGMPSIEGSAEYLAEARTLLARRATWMRALLCEVFEAQCELSVGNEERLADELLDVATVALRWRRAILERGK